MKMLLKIRRMFKVSEKTIICGDFGFIDPGGVGRKIRVLIDGNEGGELTIMGLVMSNGIDTDIWAKGDLFFSDDFLKEHEVCISLDAKSDNLI
jgi:hypothetical protein